MKIIYNNAELQHNNKSYNLLINRPSLNGHLLEGNISLDTLSLYDKPTTEKLVEATSQIRLVSTMPADPEPNMTYYVGPDERNLYDVILVNDAKQLIHMGTTQFGQYKSGPGINVEFDNTININTDDLSIYIDSEGNIASTLDGDALPAFTGATSSTAGTKGLVPKPLATSKIEILRGDSTWVPLVDVIYPVGSLYLDYSGSNNPNTMFPGTTWSRYDSGYVLWNDQTGGGGKIDEGIPNITGQFIDRPACNNTSNATGAFSGSSFSKEINDGIGLGSSYGISSGNIKYSFDASTVNSIYGNSDTVRPRSYKVNVWERTA